MSDLDKLITRQYKDREFHWLATDSGAWEGPHREWEGLKDICVRHCKGRDAVITAGGCLGLYPVLWADVFDRVITFEPCPRNFHVLNLNCEKFHPKIERYNVALGDSSNDTVLFRHSPSNVGTHSTARGSSDRVDVKQMVIDDLDLPALDLISLDTEGAETYIIRGALKTIEKFRPVLTIETVDQAIKSMLDERGYRQVGRNVSDSVFAFFSR